jgi:hypothetical protein
MVVLPAAGGGRLRDRRLRQWLAQAELGRAQIGRPVLSTVLEELGRTVPAGLAALRLWGATGERPSAWVAAADPVWLEPRLGSLCLHDLGDTVTPAELRLFTEHLQAMLGADDRYEFAVIGDGAYVSAQVPFPTAAVPAASIDGGRPDSYLPDGPAAAGHRRLISEIEMALHEHPANAARAITGQRPVNALWLWGGGTAEERVVEALPPLFADDTLAKGYWLSKTGISESWPGSIGACLDAAAPAFVALAPAEDDAPALESLLGELRKALRSGRVERLVLWFMDGLRADVRRTHALRLWRLHNTLLERGQDGE